MRKSRYALTAASGRVHHEPTGYSLSGNKPVSVYIAMERYESDRTIKIVTTYFWPDCAPQSIVTLDRKSIIRT